VLRGENSDNWHETYASHTNHQVQMYYPMRSIRTERYKYILNLAHELTVPMASDLYESKTWQSTLARQENQ
jgi:N-sulfoglucosamine sulfohydrolase